MKFIILISAFILSSCSLVSKYTKPKNEVQSFFTSGINLTNENNKTLYVDVKDFTGLFGQGINLKSKRLELVSTTQTFDVKLEIVLKSFNKVSHDVVDSMRRQEFNNEISSNYIIQNNTVLIKTETPLPVSTNKPNSSGSFWDYTTGGVVGSAVGYAVGTSATAVSAGGFVGILGAKYVSLITKVNSYLLVVDINVFEKSHKPVINKYKQVFKNSDNSMSEYYDEFLEKNKKMTTKFYVIVSGVNLDILEATQIATGRINSALSEFI